MSHDKMVQHILNTLPLKGPGLTDADALNGIRMSDIPAEDLPALYAELEEKGLIVRGRVNTPSVNGEMWYATEAGKKEVKKK